MRINGRDYKVQELDFNAICELEEKGVELLGMSEKNPKLATMVRGFVAWVMNVPAEVAAKEIQHHIQNGGSFEGILQMQWTILVFSRQADSRNSPNVRKISRRRKTSIRIGTITTATGIQIIHRDNK